MTQQALPAEFPHDGQPAAEHAQGSVQAGWWMVHSPIRSYNY
ncbi:MAG: hypothetical protein RBR29_01250 [Castellaniella sp.]|nr:hypothetical protein [Castellaniella sp.]MDY0308408.1 hypothetical protein [Castellaniella sp.]